MVILIQTAKRDKSDRVLKFKISGLVGINVTMPNTPNLLNVLDWAYLAPRPQNRLAEPRSATSYKAPPVAALALSTSPI
jgi:hypothetical protein